MLYTNIMKFSAVKKKYNLHWFFSNINEDVTVCEEECST